MIDELRHIDLAVVQSAVGELIGHRTFGRTYRGHLSFFGDVAIKIVPRAVRGND